MSGKIVQFNQKFFLSLSILLICFFIDRISKIYVVNLFIKNNVNDLYINKYINITLLWNKGIAFGLLQSETLVYQLITFIIFLIIIFILYLIYKSEKIIELIGFSAIAGGAMGNLTDRFYYNAVPDFIDIHYNSFHWFTFNVSDICISVGIFLILFSDVISLKNKNEEIINDDKKEDD